MLMFHLHYEINQLISGFCVSAKFITTQDIPVVVVAKSCGVNMCNHLIWQVFTKLQNRNPGQKSLTFESGNQTCEGSGCTYRNEKAVEWYRFQFVGKFRCTFYSKTVCTPFGNQEEVAELFV